MRVIEAANKKIYERELSSSNELLRGQERIDLGRMNNLDTVLLPHKDSGKKPDDVLIIVNKNKVSAALNDGGIVDASTITLRESLSRSKFKLTGRNLGLVVLSDPDQTWKKPTTINPHSYKFKKVDAIDRTNAPGLLIKDLNEDDSMFVLATPRQGAIDEQISSIVDHFAKVIQSK